jgi:O-methyltransferase involved in polyketide biosynthesis
MPLAWKIARLEQMVVCTSEGTVTLSDMQSYFRALDEAGAFPYQKIFVATAGVSMLSRDDVQTVASELQSRRRTGHFGEVAVVAGAARNNQLADIFRMLSQVDRPLYLCRTIHEARQWLARRRASTLSRRPSS